jgi:L-2-hydroxyglutarate oxidase LhgO
VTVIEKEDQVATHQTGHNSGVVHSGIYYAPGSLKARLTRQGIARLRAYCVENELPYIARGKLIVAADEEEVPRLNELERRGKENGLRDLQRLHPSRLTTIEPAVSGVAGLFVPETAVVDYPAVARTLADEVVGQGGRVLTGHRVRRIERVSGAVELELDGPDEQSMKFESVIVCAGQQADRLALGSGESDVPRIVPFFGRYWNLDPAIGQKVRGLIYPVPDPRYPFLGVHFTRGVDDRVKVGPGAVVALGREAYDRESISWRDTRELLVSKPFWSLGRNHWRTGVKELSVFASTRVLARKARPYLDEVRGSHLVPSGGGIRAQAVDSTGRMLDDFEIRGGDRVFHVLNAPSPAATASLAIASELAGRLYPDAG